MKKIYFHNLFLIFKKIDASNNYVFETNTHLTKLDIKKNFKKLYNIQPKKINILNFNETGGVNRRYRNLKNSTLKKKVIITF